MMFYIFGLGNPGEKYALTRHNAGRIILDLYLKSKLVRDAAKLWKRDKKTNSLKSEVKIGKNKVLFFLPETFMNNSGKALKPIITSKNKARNLIVIHDDLDLTFGKFKTVFNRGSAGHKGVESIMRAVKTKEFARIRVGIAPTTPSGKTRPVRNSEGSQRKISNGVKKPKDKKLLDFITSNFKPREIQALKKMSPKIFEAIDLIIENGLQKAMNKFN